MLDGRVKTLHPAIHGGILATMLDELMAHAVWHFAGPGLTLGLEVRFHAPLKPDENILVRGVLHTKHGSRRLAEGEVILQGDPGFIRTHETVIEKYLGKGHAGR